MEEMRDTNALASAAVPKRNMIPKPITNRPQPRTINFCANPAAVRDTIVINIPEITHANPDTPNAKMMEPMVTTPAKMSAIAAIARGSAMGDEKIPKITSHRMEPKPFVVFFSCCSSIFFSVVSAII